MDRLYEIFLTTVCEECFDSHNTGCDLFISTVNGCPHLKKLRNQLADWLEDEFFHKSYTNGNLKREMQRKIISELRGKNGK